MPKTITNKQLAEKLAHDFKLCPAIPETVNTYDIGGYLDEIMREAGYELELHQLGIGGTSVIAVKVN